MYSQFAVLLEKNNITAYKVFKDTGIAQSTLSSWKKGKIMPKVDKLIKLANYFNVPLAYFLVAEEKERQDELIAGSMGMFAKRLRMLRNENMLTQRELAERMNLSGATIAMYETSRRSPDRMTIIKLAKMFQVSVDYLLGESIVRNRTDTDAFNVTGNVTELAEERYDKRIIENENIFGKRLKRIRKENDLIQEELAKLINTTKANISKYETGRIEPNIETIRIFADFFKVSTDYLFGVTDIRNYADIRGSYLPGEVVDEMNELINDLTKMRKATTTELFLACDCGDGRELTAQDEMEFTDKLHEIQRLDGKIKLLKEMSQQKTEIDIEQLEKK